MVDDRCSNANTLKSSTLKVSVTTPNALVVTPLGRAVKPTNGLNAPWHKGVRMRLRFVRRDDMSKYYMIKWKNPRSESVYDQGFIGILKGNAKEVKKEAKRLCGIPESWMSLERWKP